MPHYFTLTSTLALGASAQTGLSFGTCQILLNLLVFLPVVRFDLTRIGVGTVTNMTGIGCVADLCPLPAPDFWSPSARS